MPFQSHKQRKFLYATNPKLAKEFSKKTSKQQMKNLPEKKNKPFKMKNQQLLKMLKKNR